MSDEEWGSPKRGRQKSEQRQRHVVVSVRLNAAELEAIQRKADALGLTISTYLRYSALTGAR